MLKKLYILVFVLFVALQAQALTVTSEAGKLYTLVTDHNITSLVVKGVVDARDFKFITDELGKLKSLDLSSATIAAYNSTLDDNLIAGDYQYAANTLPYCALTGMITLQTLKLPTSITAIDYGAVAGCSKLTTIYFPSALKTIGDDAFNSCTALTQVTISSSIAHLGSNAFAHCKELTQLTINPNVQLAIGDEAFADCNKLSNVTIGPKVTAIGNGAFSGCSALTSLNIMDGSQLEDIGDNAFYHSGLNELNFEQMPQLKHLGAWALARTKLYSINLPAHVKQLDEGTFFYSKQLTRLQLPKTLTYLPDYMLAGCERIKGEPFMTQNLGNIGDYAIYNQSQHNAITVPFNVYYIGTQAMAGMTGLDEITSEPLEVPELGEDVWAGIDQSRVKLNVSSESLNDYMAAEQWMNFLVNVAQLRGDVNSDGFVNTADANAERDYVVDGNAQGIDTNRTDVNGDGEVNVADIVSIYNIINGTEPVDKPYRTYFDDFIGGKGVSSTSTNVNLDILLENSINYTAFQLNIATPSYITINNATLSGRCVGHELFFKQQSANYYYLVCFSPAGDDIEGYEGAILTLNVSSSKPVGDDDTITLQEINFVDQQEKVYRRHEKTINLLGTTAIENINVDLTDKPVNVYNTQGQLLRQNVPASTATQGLPSGIYIVGNKKVVIK